MNLALLYYKQGKTGPAEELFRDMTARHPENPEGFYYLALLYGEQQRYPEAIALMEKASAIPGRNTRILYNLGLLYQMTGQDARCEATLSAGLREEPCNYEILYALYAFYMNKNERGKAAPVIEKMTTCFPADRQVQELHRKFLTGH
jgi:cytochrome c-type biogenesis protein CcmH/NrfG